MVNTVKTKAMLFKPSNRPQLFDIYYTLGPPYALGTMFFEIRGWYAEKLYVTPWYQVFGEPVPCDGSRDLSFRFICVCVMDGHYICVVAFLVVAGMCKFTIDSLYIRLIGLF